MERAKRRMYAIYLKEWARVFHKFGIYSTELCSEKINVHASASIKKEMVQIILSFDHSGSTHHYVLSIGCVCECASITPLHLFMDFYFPGKSWSEPSKKIMYPSQLQKIFHFMIRDIFHTVNRYVSLYGEKVIEKIRVRLYDRKKKFSSYPNFIIFSAFELIVLLKYSNNPYEVYSISCC